MRARPKLSAGIEATTLRSQTRLFLQKAGDASMTDAALRSVMEYRTRQR